jgi:hypothetical protein
MIHLKLFDEKYVVTLNGILSYFVLGEAATPSIVDVSHGSSYSAYCSD